MNRAPTRNPFSPSCPWSSSSPPLRRAADPFACAHSCACAGRAPEDCGGDGYRDTPGFQSGGGYSSESPCGDRPRRGLPARWLADVVYFIFRQVADLFRVVHAGFRRELFGALLADAVNGRQADPQPLLRRKIHTCDTCHALFSLKSFQNPKTKSSCSKYQYYPWRCLCFGLLQITRTTPRR